MKNHWQGLQRILRYVSQNPFLGIWIQPSSSAKNEAFSDADWVGDLFDRRSHGGFVTHYGGNLILWQSMKQPTVVRSSTEAEYKGIADAASEILWLRKVLEELGEILESSSVLWCDSPSAINLTANPILHAKTKHVAGSYYFVHERVADDSISVKHVPSREQLADILRSR